MSKIVTFLKNFTRVYFTVTLTKKVVLILTVIFRLYLVYLHYILGLLEPKTEIQETKEPDESQPFFSKEELAIWDAEDHQSFYPDSVPCHKTADPDDERETCLDPKCDRKFLSYFSMMRHVAFAHYPARTAKAMKLKVLKNSQV